MTANVGEMFYAGEVPWHGEGVNLDQPATLDEAFKAGGLDWEVGERGVQFSIEKDLPPTGNYRYCLTGLDDFPGLKVTASDGSPGYSFPVVMVTASDGAPDPVCKEVAIARLDRPDGDPRRLLGVVHRGFVPVQNRDAGMLFDAIFGHGKRVYHTGGYLGEGEVIWLLARIDRTLCIGREDIVQPYALMANSHDGSRAFSIRLTTVRVVCQNTLALAFDQTLGEQFYLPHQGSVAKHAEAAQWFFKRELDSVAESFALLSKRSCSDEEFEEILETLLPEPRIADYPPGRLRYWEERVAEVQAARHRISELRWSGKGMEMDGSRGTFWGVLNAILEYVDHYRRVSGSRLSYALLGDGMDLKVRAFQLIQEQAARASVVSDRRRALA